MALNTIKIMNRIIEVLSEVEELHMHGVHGFDDYNTTTNIATQKIIMRFDNDERDIFNDEDSELKVNDYRFYININGNDFTITTKNNNKFITAFYMYGHINELDEFASRLKTIPTAFI